MNYLITGCYRKNLFFGKKTMSYYLRTTKILQNYSNIMIIITRHLVYLSQVSRFFIVKLNLYYYHLTLSSENLYKIQTIKNFTFVIANLCFFILYIFKIRTFGILNLGNCLNIYLLIANPKTCSYFRVEYIFLKIIDLVLHLDFKAQKIA